MLGKRGRIGPYDCFSYLPTACPNGNIFILLFSSHLQVTLQRQTKACMQSPKRLLISWNCPCFHLQTLRLFKKNLIFQASLRIMVEQSCFRWHPLQGVQDGIGPDSWISDAPSPLTCMYYLWAQMISAWLVIESQFFSYDILYLYF